MPNQSETVDLYMSELVHPRKPEIERIRAIILGAGDGITEQIKWKAPSFCYQGDDRVTFRLQPGDRVQLIFHRGAKVKDSSDFSFEDSSGLIEWVARDRGVVTFERMSDIETNAAALAQLVDAWMKATSP